MIHQNVPWGGRELRDERFQQLSAALKRKDPARAQQQRQARQERRRRYLLETGREFEAEQERRSA